MSDQSSETLSAAAAIVARRAQRPEIYQRPTAQAIDDSSDEEWDEDEASDESEPEECEEEGSERGSSKVCTQIAFSGRSVPAQHHGSWRC